MTELDPCTKCPLFDQYYDYWGECNESCEKGYRSWFSGRYHFFCFLPRIVKIIWKKIKKVKEKMYE